MTQTEFQTAFEAVAPEMVDAVVRYVRGDERVTDVWIYASFQDAVGAQTAVYKVAGKLIPLREAEPVFGNPNSTIVSLAESLFPLHFEIEDRSQLPNSMVVHHDLKTQQMDAEFSYERIVFQNHESDSTHAARWAREFKG